LFLTNVIEKNCCGIGVLCTWARNSGWILLNCVPEGLDVEELERRLIKNVPSVFAVHELHVWTLTAK
jgi:Co/Zn/Cd efflux system component